MFGKDRIHSGSPSAMQGDETRWTGKSMQELVNKGQKFTFSLIDIREARRGLKQEGHMVHLAF